MLRLKRAATLAAILAVAACTADSTSPTAPTVGPRATISDAAHSGVVPGFYFLPPLVPQPSYSGTFDAALTPSVQICELSGTTCGPVIATFTFGTGTSNVKVDVPGQTYQVNWKTSDYNLDVSKFYRISVYQGSFLLGFADVDVVGAAKDLRNVDTGQYIALLDDRTLPIKFRIETGIPAQVVVTPASDSVNVGETKQFTASCLDLHGNAVPCPATIWSSSNPAVATVSATGLATGVSQGTVTITASIGYASGTATLKVLQPDTPPVANPDTFQAIGNVTIPVAAPGVLANDTDAETPSGLSVVAGTVASTGGGTVTLAADGSFTYLSAAGFTGTDSFDYVVTDGTLADTSTVTMNVPNRVWFVDNAGAAPGDGRDSSPFAALASAEASSAAGETVFLRYGNGTSAGYDAGFTFKNGQSLIGQGITANATAVVNGQTIVLLAAGSAPTVTNAASGTTLQLAQNNTVQGLNVNSTAGAGIAGSGFGTFTASIVNVAATGGASLDLQTGTAAASFATLSSSNSVGAGLRLSGVGGTITAPAGVVTNAAGAGVDISGGDADVSYGGSISGSGTRAASVTGRTGGTLTLSGAISDTNGGISVQNNTGGTIAFTGSSKSLSTGATNGVTLANNSGATVSFGGGGLDVSTTTGTGFSATGGGTVTVTGAGNTLATANGTALSVANTTIGASGLSFRSISASGDANGIVLDNTGALNGLQVTGDGATAGSGGTLQNASQHGVKASNAVNVHLAYMILLNNGTANLDPASVCGDALAGTNTNCAAGIDLQNVSGVVLSHDSIDGGAQIGINGNAVSGLTVTSSTVRNAGNEALEDGVQLRNLTGTATVTDSRFTGSFHRQFEVENGSGSLSLSITGSTFDRGTYVSTASDGLAVVARGSASVNASVQGSTFRRNFQNGVFARSFETGSLNLLLGDTTAGGSANGNVFADNSLFTQVLGDNASTLRFGIGWNTATVSATVTSGATPVTFRKGLGATGSYRGLFAFNTIGSGAALSGNNCAGCNGVSMTDEGLGGGYNVRVLNNTVQHVNQRGVETIAQSNDAMSVIVRNNAIQSPDGTVGQAVFAQSSNDAADVGTLCMDVSGNTIGGTWDSAVGGRNIRLRQAPSGGTAAFQLLTGGSGPLTASQVVTFLNANNTNALANASAATSFTAVSTCP